MRIFVLVMFILIILSGILKFLELCFKRDPVDGWDATDMLFKTGLAIWAGIVLWG